MKKRSFSIKLLLSSLIFSLALSFGVLSVNVQANEEATSTAQTVETFEMADGAYVRVRSENESEFSDVTGIRFTLYFNQSQYTDLLNEDGTINSAYEIGMYIAVLEDGMSDVTAETARWTYIAEQLVSLTATEAKTDVNVYAFRAVLAGIPETEYNTMLIANGYVTKDSVTTVATNPQTKSIAQVASKALVSGAADSNGDLMNYVDKAVTTENFKLASTLKTDKYKSASLNEQLGATFPENLAVKWTNSNSDVVTINEETNTLSLGETRGETTITATLGSKTLTTKITNAEPTVLDVNNVNWTKYRYASGTNQTYIDYAGSATELTAISGDYTGNVVKYKAFNTYKDNYTVLNTISYSDDELNAIKEDYNSVSIWVALDPSIVSASWRNAGTYGNDTLTINFREKADGVSTTIGTWQKWTISIDEYIELLAAHDNAYLTLFAINPGTANSSSDNTKWGIYVGNIVFDIVKPDAQIITVSDTTWKNYKYAAANSTNYVDYAGSSTELTSITGEYTGNAVKYKAFAVYNNNYSILNSLTQEELTEMKKYYSSVSLWIAFDTSLTGIRFLGAGTYGANVLGVNFREKADGVSTDLGCWQKWTVTIDEYIDLVAANDYNSITLMGCVPTSASVFGIYVGDIFFE